MEISTKGLVRLTLILSVLVPVLSGSTGCERDKNPPDEKPFVRLLENQAIQSRIFNREVYYSVLLPENYHTSKDSFPVVYLLHGYGDDQASWNKYGLIQYYSDSGATENGQMIFIMPQGFNSYYVNRYNGSVPYMDFFTMEFVPHIDSIYRTIKDKEHRAVMGYSMGGYGALIMPAKNPGIFKTGVLLSMSFRTDSQYMAEPQEVFDSQWGPVFGGIGAAGEDRLTDYFKSSSPFYFFANQVDPSLAGLNLYIDCGDDEETLSETSDELHNLLRDLEFPHEYRMNDGGHSWDYWHKELPEALRYIGFAFQQIPYPSDPDPVDPGSSIPADRIITEQLTGTDITFRVVLPSGYSDGSVNYPVILAIHDRDTENKEEESQKLFSLLTRNMTAGRLPLSLIIEIPLQAETLTNESMHNLISQVRENYRTVEDRNHAVLLGNNNGGLLVYQLMHSCSDFSNAFLLFDALLPVNATVNDADGSYYLDICEQGTSYKGYHSLYMCLRQNQVNHEYRIRQGTPSHDSFLAGLDEACGFMKDHLK